MLDERDARAAQTAATNLSARRRARLARVVLSIVGIVGFVSVAAASGAPRIHLRGIARIDAHVARSQGKLVLRGTVTDDMGAAVEHARVTAAISTERSDARAPALLDLAPTALEACSDLWQAPVLEGTDRIVAATDDAARFCLRLALPTGRYVAHIEATGGGFVDGARIDLPVDLALEPVTLRFDPEKTVLALDDESTPIDVIASTEDDGLTAAAAHLPLALSNEAGRALGDATTDSAGRARFALAGALLGPAGQGELRVAFGGSAMAGASSYAMTVERRARVELEVPQAAGGRLPIGSSEEEIALHVVARAACASRGCAGTPTGTVEVRLGEGDSGGIVGAAALVRGEASVALVFATPSGGDGEAPLRLDYVPDAPWFESTGPLRLTQPLHPPGAWNRIVLAATGLTVLAWLIVGRLPRRSDSRDRSSGRVKIAESASRVEVVSPGVAGAEQWTGRIVDGHDGTPVAEGRVAIERPGFDRAEIMAEATSDAEGRFALAPVAVQPGDQLLAEGRLHGPLRVPLPPFGEIRVALVSRRRALLDRLVRWARRKGRPFDAQPEPTPGHVQRMARSGDAAKGWAEAVERAAYSGAAVDARSEAEVDRLAPADSSPARGAGKT